jgi:PAS domain S-box-containing protein
MLAFGYLFLFPIRLSAGWPMHLLRLATFTVVAFFVVWAIAAEKRAIEALSRAHDELQRRNEDLRVETTKRQRTEESLQDREELMRLLTENSNDFIRLHAVEGRSTYASASVERLYGRRPTSMFEFVHPDDLAACQAWWKQILAGGTERLHWRVRDAGGNWRWLETAASLVQIQNEPHVLTVCRDVTDQRQAEDALRDRERKLSEAQRLAHLAYWEYDFSRNRLTWSEEFCRILGLPLDELSRTMDEFMELVHPEDWSIFKKLITREMRGESGREAYRIIRPSGDVRYLEKIFSAIRDKTGRAVRAVGAVQDVTERKRAEEALHDSERKLKEAQRITHVGHWERDVETGLITWSDELYRIFGVLPQQGALTTSDWQNLIHPEDRQRIVQAVSEAERGIRHYDVEYRIVRPNGEVRFIHSKGELDWDDQGRPRRAFGAAQDITERRRAEQALRISEGKLKDAERLANIGYWDFDIVADRITWSDETCRIFGRTSADSVLRQAELREMIHPDDRQLQEQALAEARQGRGQYDVEYRIVRPDGEVRFVHVRNVHVGDASDRPVRMFGTVQDITERKRMEDALRESADRLQQLSRRLLEVQEEERRHLARELHDEFGQLLATITVHLHAAKGLAGEAARASLEECMALLQRAGEEVRGLALELRPTMLETSGLDATLRWLAQQHQQRTRIEVEVVDYSNGVSGEVAIACFRVAQEALTNVVRHAQAQHAWLELSKRESTVELVVRDDGVGFDVTTARERAARNGRLGLLGMSERVQILGGSLEVDSQPGRGTRIRASFPLAAAAGAAEPTE